MFNCDDINIIDYFSNETTLKAKKSIDEHIKSCSDCEKLFTEYKELFNNLHELNIKLPDEADENYFAKLNLSVSNKVSLICNSVEELLVDYIEGNLDGPNNLEKKLLVENHLELCKSCTQEYFLTKKVMDINLKEQKNNDEYFSSLADKITDKIFSKVDSICENAQNFIPNFYTKEEIPKNYKNHIQSCETCQKELENTNALLNNIKTLEVSLPDRSYFDALSYRIENAINLIPNYKNIKNYTFRTSLKELFNFILRPQIAVTSTAILSLLVFASLTFYEHKEANTPYTFSKIDNKTTSTQDDDFKIKDIKTDIETASRDKLFFKQDSLSTPEKDASMDQNLIETAASKKNK